MFFVLSKKGDTITQLSVNEFNSSSITKDKATFSFIRLNYQLSQHISRVFFREKKLFPHIVLNLILRSQLRLGLLI